MTVAGINDNLGSYIQSLYAKNSTKSAASADETETVSETEELSDAEKLENFKKEIWDEINSYPWDSVMNISIQITDGAFQRMMEDSDYKDEMLTALYNEALAAHPPGHTTLLWVEESGCHGYAYFDNEAADVAFQAHSNHKNTFYVQKATGGDDANEIWLQWQQERQEQREWFNQELERKQYLNHVYQHKEDVAKLYEEKTIVN